MSTYSSAGKIANFSPRGVTTNLAVMGDLLSLVDRAARPDVGNDNLGCGFLKENTKVSNAQALHRMPTKFCHLAGERRWIFRVGRQLVRDPFSHIAMLA